MREKGSSGKPVLYTLSIIQISERFTTLAEHEDQSYIVMQYLDGQTLKQYIDQKQLITDRTLEIGSQVADALDRAQSTGIIHRDIKPTNIFINRDEANVLDFGLTKMPQNSQEKYDSE